MKREERRLGGREGKHRRARDTELQSETSMACKCSSLLSFRVSYVAAGAAAALLGFWTGGQARGHGQGRGERRQEGTERVVGGGALVAASCVYAKVGAHRGLCTSPATMVHVCVCVCRPQDC